MRWLLLAAMAMGGCTTATAVIGPDGSTHYDVHCPRSVANCYEKIAEVCPAGYETVNATSDVRGVPVQNGGTVMVTSHDMLIKCRQATAAAR